MKLTQVAAAVLQRPDGTFLLGRRAPGTFYPGYWEFPGGKVETGETPRDALVRELSEELGIRVRRAYPWLVREHRYEHAHVRLHFFRVVEWEGELRDHVHTALTWQHAGATDVTPMLPANGPILKSLALPDFYAITHAAQIGIDAQLQQLGAALAGGLRLLQIREPDLAPVQREEFARAAIALCRQHGARVLINCDAALAARLGADGVHLPARLLATLAARPDLPWVGASCHNAAELERAARLEVDFAVLGPVRATASHPDRAALGWPRFAELVAACGFPVFALGGLAGRDLDLAWQAGAHGVAAIRAAWRADS